MKKIIVFLVTALAIISCSACDSSYSGGYNGNGYTLNIHSSNGEKFQNTKATKACFAINQLSISAFCEGRTSSDDINLIKRLDEIRNIKGEYKDESF